MHWPGEVAACSVFAMSTSSSCSCTSPALLRRGEKVFSHEGDVYIVPGWTKHFDQENTSNYWYWKEASGEATWNFPRHDAVKVYSKRDVPDGWAVYYDDVSGFYWWWNEARNFYTYSTRSSSRYGHWDCMSLHMLTGTSTNWREYNATGMSCP